MIIIREYIKELHVGVFAECKNMMCYMTVCVIIISLGYNVKLVAN